MLSMILSLRYSIDPYPVVRAIRTHQYPCSVQYDSHWLHTKLIESRARSHHCDNRTRQARHRPISYRRRNRPRSTLKSHQFTHLAYPKKKKRGFSLSTILRAVNDKLFYESTHELIVDATRSRRLGHRSSVDGVTATLQLPCWPRCRNTRPRRWLTQLGLHRGEKKNFLDIYEPRKAFNISHGSWTATRGTYLSNW